MKIIVSTSSTSVSSNPFVETLIVPLFEPSGIFIEVAETVNSVVSLAVPLIVKGTSIGLPAKEGIEAVKTTSVDEFSLIVVELIEKETTGGSLPSVIVIVLRSVIELVAFTVDVLGVTIIFSSNSYEESVIDVNFITSVVEPALITIFGFNATFCTLWLFRSTIYKSPLELIKESCGTFNWFNALPDPFPPATTLPEIDSGIHLIILWLSVSLINITLSEFKSIPRGYLNWSNPLP